MIRCDTFIGSLLLAALAAAGWMPWAIVAVPFVGSHAAFAGYLVAMTALYVAAIVPSDAGPRVLSRLGAIVIVTVTGLALAALTGSNVELAIALVGLLGLARSGFLYRSKPARALVTEVVLLAGGLCFASLLRHFHSPIPALWGFLLVQSLFFLVPGRAPRRADPQLDPFEAAHRRAIEVLERVSA